MSVMGSTAMAFLHPEREQGTDGGPGRLIGRDSATGEWVVKELGAL